MFTVTVDVKNAGKCAGKECVQLYVSDPESSVEKPTHWLVAFSKTDNLKPGETQTLIMSFTEKDLAHFDEKSSAWLLDGGDYELQIAASSRDVRLRSVLSIPADKVIEKVKNVLKMK